VALCLRRRAGLVVQVLERAEHHLSPEQRCITQSHRSADIARANQSSSHGSTYDPRPQPPRCAEKPWPRVTYGEGSAGGTPPPPPASSRRAAETVGPLVPVGREQVRVDGPSRRRTSARATRSRPRPARRSPSRYSRTYGAGRGSGATLIARALTSRRRRCSWTHVLTRVDARSLGEGVPAGGLIGHGYSCR